MEAFKWFEIAAEKGLPQAQYELADCYHHGRGTVVDLQEALRWSGLAASHAFKPAEELKAELEKEMAEAASVLAEAQPVS